MSAPEAGWKTGWLSSNWMQATKCTLIICKVNCILSYAGRGMASTEGSCYLPIFCNGKAAPQTACPVSSLPSGTVRNCKGCSRELSAQLEPSTHNPSGETGELGLLSLAKRRARGIFHCSLLLPEGKTTVKLLPVAADHIMKGNPWLHLGGLRVDVGKDFFPPESPCNTGRGCPKKPWNSYPWWSSRIARESNVGPQTGLVTVLLQTGDWTRISQRAFQPACRYFSHTMTVSLIPIVLSTPGAKYLHFERHYKAVTSWCSPTPSFQIQHKTLWSFI